MWQDAPYTSALILSVLVNVFLAAYMWRRRGVAGGRAFLWLLISSAVWSAFYAVNMARPDLETKVFWMKMTYFGIAPFTTLWFLFTIQYAERPWRSRIYKLLAIEPIAVVVMVWTSPYHSLHWASLTLIDAGGFTVVKPTYGIWFWIHAAYAYVLLLSGTVVILSELLRSAHSYRRQIAIVLIGSLIPWAGNALYLSGASPFPYLDLAPIGFTLTCAAIAWGIYRFRFLDVLPVARDAIMAGLEEGIIVLDIHDRLTYYNPAAHNILGLDPGQALGLPGSNIPELRAYLTDQMGEERGYSEISIGDGEARRAYAVHHAPLYGRPGLAGRLVVFHDITERKETERTLLEMKDAAEAASAAKSEFFANISHELRTPLNVILGHTQILQGTPSGDDATDRGLKMIESQSAQLLQLVTAVIDLSKIERAQLTLESMVVDLGDTLQDVANEFEPRCQAKGLGWEIDVRLTQPVVRADGEKLRQVWVALLDYAVKMTEQGGITFRVEDRPHDRLYFEVIDTDPGIEIDQLEILFEPFQQSAVGANQGGIGLGLAIARHHVELMGGELLVESIVGSGTRFYAEIELNRSETDTQESFTIQKATEAESPKFADVELPSDLHAKLVTSIQERNITSLRTALTEADVPDPKQKEFVDHLRTLAAGFELDAIEAILTGTSQ